MRKRMIRLVVWFLTWLEDKTESLHEWVCRLRAETNYKLRKPTEYVVIGEIGTGRTFRYAKGYELIDGYELLYDHVPKWAKKLPVKTLELSQFDAMLKNLYLVPLRDQVNNQSEIWGRSPLEPLIPLQMAFGREAKIETVITNHTKEMNEDEV